MAGTALLMASCAPAGDAWMMSSMTAAAKDQIMLVREAPPSFGYQRLVTLSRLYPELGAFVTKRGLPDFLAETGDQEGYYFILYYLKDRKAFACRTRSGKGQAVEFAGPYPITTREFHLLDGFRRDPNRRPV